MNKKKAFSVIVFFACIFAGCIAAFLTVKPAGTSHYTGEGENASVVMERYTDIDEFWENRPEGIAIHSDKEKFAEGAEGFLSGSISLPAEALFPDTEYELVLLRRNGTEATAPVFLLNEQGTPELTGTMHADFVLQDMENSRFTGAALLAGEEVAAEVPLEKN